LGSKPVYLNSLAAPATLVVEGCNITGELEEWLQVTVPIREQFQPVIETAAKMQPMSTMTLSISAYWILSPGPTRQLWGRSSECPNNSHDGCSCRATKLLTILFHDLNTALAEPQKVSAKSLPFRMN
jgi:hypothetical protein